MADYTFTHETLDPKPNVKVVAAAGAAAAVVSLLGRRIGLGLLAGLAALVAGYYVPPLPEDGVITKVEPEPPDDLDAEEVGLHFRRGVSG